MGDSQTLEVISFQKGVECKKSHLLIQATLNYNILFTYYLLLSLVCFFKSFNPLE